MTEKIKNIFGEVIELERNMSVSSEKFADLFSDASELTYVELMQIENEKQYGYKKYIEKWREEGLI